MLAEAAQGDHEDHVSGRLFEDGACENKRALCTLSNLMFNAESSENTRHRASLCLRVLDENGFKISPPFALYNEVLVVSIMQREMDASAVRIFDFMVEKGLRWSHCCSHIYLAAQHGRTNILAKVLTTFRAEITSILRNDTLMRNSYSARQCLHALMSSLLYAREKIARMLIDLGVELGAWDVTMALDRALKNAHEDSIDLIINLYPGAEISARTLAPAIVRAMRAAPPAHEQRNAALKVLEHYSERFRECTFDGADDAVRNEISAAIASSGVMIKYAAFFGADPVLGAESAGAPAQGMEKLP